MDDSETSGECGAPICTKCQSALDLQSRREIVFEDDSPGYYESWHCRNDCEHRWLTRARVLATDATNAKR